MAFYVYRMQNKNGKGCYLYGGRSWQMREHDAGTDTPGPNQDFLLSGPWAAMSYPAQEKHRFGFKDRDQAARWFSCPDEVENLRKDGFTLQKVMAESVVIGDKQVAFIPKKEERNGRINQKALLQVNS